MYKMYSIFGVKVDKETYDKYANRKYPFTGTEDGVNSELLWLYAHSDQIAAFFPDKHQEAREIIDKVKEELSALPTPDNLNKICPMSIASGNPCKCREDCALFVTYPGWDEGCCAIVAAATCIRNIDDSLNEDGILGELNDIATTLNNANATP